jgi:hypothetical protein
MKIIFFYYKFLTTYIPTPIFPVWVQRKLLLFCGETEITFNKHLARLSCLKLRMLVFWTLSIARYSKKL